MNKFVLTAVAGLLSILVVDMSQTAWSADAARSIDPNPRTGSSAAVVVGNVALVHTTQLLPVNDDGTIAGTEAATQFEHVLDRLDETLLATGSGLAQVVKLNVYVTRQDAVPVIERTMARRLAGARLPAVSFVVTKLPRTDALVAADAVAESGVFSRKSVSITERDRRVGATSSALTVMPPGTRIYVSGQAERSEDLAEATRETLQSLRKTLEFLGRSDRDIVQLKAFVMPIANAAVVQREIDVFFGQHPVPPVVLVEWQSSPTVPIEIELIAWGGQPRGEESHGVEYLTPPGMTASPVYCRVARVRSPQVIYVSGLYGSHAEMTMADAETPSVGEREVKDIFAQLQHILKRAGGDLRHLVKATYYVSTDAASKKLNELRPNYYDPKRPPAASKAIVTGIGREGLGLTVDMIAIPVPENKQK